MPSAYSVPTASDVLPEPDTPTTATVRHSGTSTSTFCRLLCRAPRTPMTVGKVSGTGISGTGISGTGISVAAIPGNLHTRQSKAAGQQVPGQAPHRGQAGPGAMGCRVTQCAGHL